MLHYHCHPFAVLLDTLAAGDMVLRAGSIIRLPCAVLFVFVTGTFADVSKHVSISFPRARRRDKVQRFPWVTLQQKHGKITQKKI